MLTLTQTFIEVKNGTTGARFDEGDYVLMQFTGLKDKNGKEIYEGDFLRGANRHDGGPSEVRYGNGQWQPFAFVGIFDGSKYEVIGNVYKNPELLK